MRVSSEQDQWAGKGGFKQRHKAHNKSAMMETDVDRRSLFYNSYPNKNSEWFSQNKDNCKGNFQQLKQVIGIGYSQTKMTEVCDLFHWSTEVIQMLEQSNASGAPDLVHKKHRLVCYLLEKFFDLLLGKKSVSSNPGFESFVGQWAKT